MFHAGVVGEGVCGTLQQHFFFFYVLEASGKGTNLESLVGELGFGQSELMDSLKNASCSLFFKVSPSSRSYEGWGGGGERSKIQVR